MKMAIGTDDKYSIREGHFGESQFYSIYEIFNGEIFSQELRKNPFLTDKETHHGQTEIILDLLDDCQIFIGKSMGKKSLSKIAKKNIEVLITKIDSVEKAVNYYLNSKDEYFEYYDKNMGRFCECKNRMQPSQANG